MVGELLSHRPDAIKSRDTGGLPGSEIPAAYTEKS